MSHIKYFMMPLMPLLLLAQPAGARFTNDVEVGHPRHSRPYYVERFEGWMSKHGIDFDTKEDYEHRLNVFIKNRFVLLSAKSSCGCLVVRFCFGVFLIAFHAQGCLQRVGNSFRILVR